MTHSAIRIPLSVFSSPLISPPLPPPPPAMKYLDYPLLTQLSDSLSSDTSSDLRVHARFEAYSVKPVGKEKRAFKEREEAYMSEQEGMDESVSLPSTTSSC